MNELLDVLWAEGLREVIEGYEFKFRTVLNKGRHKFAFGRKGYIELSFHKKDLQRITNVINKFREEEEKTKEEELKAVVLIHRQHAEIDIGLDTTKYYVQFLIKLTYKNVQSVEITKVIEPESFFNIHEIDETYHWNTENPWIMNQPHRKANYIKEFVKTEIDRLYSVNAPQKKAIMRDRIIYV